MAKGWISIHRKIRDSVIWDYDEPFTRRDAWIDLLLLANHQDKDKIFDGKKITVKRGQCLTSVRKLANEWHWGNTKTLAYLRLLEDCEMIVREANSRRTLITIVNYDVYQDENTEKRNTDRTLTDTVSERRPTTNNNVNNDNNENNGKSMGKSFSPPTVQQVMDYCTERGNGINAERFINFYEARGWMIGKNKMKDWKAAVRTWEQNDYNKSTSGGNETSRTKYDEHGKPIIEKEDKYEE